MPKLWIIFRTEYIEEESGKVSKIIEQKGFVRIFKDDEEIEKTKEDNGRNKKYIIFTFFLCKIRNRNFR